jgi:hypothetical protein
MMMGGGGQYPQMPQLSEEEQAVKDEELKQQY